MIISDLTYLETASEVSTIVGGLRNKIRQNNKIEQKLEQKAKAGSLAVGRGATSGDAVAVNFGVNFANISDNNQGILDLSE
jgi:hypothetical protein